MDRGRDGARRAARGARGSTGCGPPALFFDAFGDPFEGRVHPALVLPVAEEVAEVNPDEVVLAETIGVGVPIQARETRLRRRRDGRHR
jgi:isopropylmalate/homocitrate/citramalate synthase